MGDVDGDGDDGGTVSREGGCGGSSDHAPLPAAIYLALIWPPTQIPTNISLGTIIYVA